MRRTVYIPQSMVKETEVQMRTSAVLSNEAKINRDQPRTKIDRVINGMLDVPTDQCTF